MKYNHIKMNYLSEVIDDVSHNKNPYVMTIEIEL